MGNKCDLEDQRVVTFEQGKKLADELGFKFFESSAKDSINVRNVFDCLVDLICENLEGIDSIGAKDGVADLSKKSDEGGNCAC